MNKRKEEEKKKRIKEEIKQERGGLKRNDKILIRSLILKC